MKDDIRKSTQTYGIVYLHAVDEERRYAHNEAAAWRQVAWDASDSDVVGMEDETIAIIDLLLSEKDETKVFLLHRRDGGPRKGKVCLAKKVFKDPKMASSFDRSNLG